MTKKKSGLVVCISVALCILLIFSSGCSISALIFTNEHSVDNYFVASDFVTRSQENNEYKSFISAQSLAQLKHLANEESKMTIYKELYCELGYSDEEISRIGYAEIEEAISTSMEITISEQYTGVYASGDRIVLSKEECLAAATEMQVNSTDLENQYNQLMTSSITYDYKSEIIGYMKVTTRSDYIKPSTINNEIGWYNFSAKFEWLTNPEESYEDAFSIYADGCAWASGTYDIYSTMSYTKNYVGAKSADFVYIDKYTQDRQVQPSGVFYTYKVPAVYGYESGFLYNISKLCYYINAKARVNNYNNAQAFNVFSRYEHLRKVINVDVELQWSIGSWPGVSVAATVEDKHDTYASFNLTNYNPNMAWNEVASGTYSGNGNFDDCYGTANISVGNLRFNAQQSIIKSVNGNGIIQFTIDNDTYVLYIEDDVYGFSVNFWDYVYYPDGSYLYFGVSANGNLYLDFYSGTYRDSGPILVTLQNIIIVQYY